MAKKSEKPDIPADMWLHVAADALARYAAGGGHMSIDTPENDPGLIIRLDDVALGDARLPAAFVALAAATAAP